MNAFWGVLELHARVGEHSICEVGHTDDFAHDSQHCRFTCRSGTARYIYIVLRSK